MKELNKYNKLILTVENDKYDFISNNISIIPKLVKIYNITIYIENDKYSIYIITEKN